MISFDYNQGPFWLFSVVIMGSLLTVGCAGERVVSIQVGKTTKSEVIQYYGEPTLVRILPGGEMATYFPRTAHQSFSSIEVPVVGAAPSGRIQTEMQPIRRGLGTGTIRSGEHEFQETTQILYDKHEIVQEIRH